MWRTFVAALDLPRSMAVAGVVFSFVFAWWDEQKGIAARVDHADHDVDDEPFEQAPPTSHV
jgi:hypothetical protein